MTLDEYLALPEGGEKLEWINARAYAMAGGSPRHAAISGNVYALLHGALVGRSCRPFGSDLRVNVHETGAYVYPDAVVVCPPWQAAPTDPNSVTNPVVLVEVLSPSTKNYDLGAKLGHYRRMPSVQHVLFVDPEDRSVTVVSRDGTGWSLHDHSEGGVHLSAIDVTLPLDAVFADLDGLPADPAAER